MTVDVLVLNYNGKHLLETCLPSVLTAAERASFATQVWVIDNASTDGSVEWISEHYPEVAIVRQPNLGLCSFNHVLSRLPSRFAVLLNNDLELHPDCLASLLTPLWEENTNCLLTAGRLLRPDGVTYEGQKTAVAWRMGLVQATSLFPGHAAGTEIAGPCASAGAFLAVDREKFLQLGGFDPIYLPGRLEDLDFAFRAFLAGYEVEYVPAAVAIHQGAASWNQEFGVQKTHAIALRNTLLFQWLRLRHPRHLAYQAVTLPLRLLYELVQAPWLASSQRFRLFQACWQAFLRYRQAAGSAMPLPRSLRRETEFFRVYSPEHLIRAANATTSGSQVETAHRPQSPHRPLKSKQHVPQ